MATAGLCARESRQRDRQSRPGQLSHASPTPVLPRLEFAWASWPQSEESFDATTLQHVERLDAWEDIERIESSMGGAVSFESSEKSYSVRGSTYEW